MAEIQADTNPTQPGMQNPAAPVQTGAQQHRKKGPDKGGFYWGTGRRKSAVARARLKPGEGKLLINKRHINEYFARETDCRTVLAPLKSLNVDTAFDIFVNVRGGGTTGQTGAAVLGIARALKEYDENYAQKLRDGGYLTRDSRMVERKKPGRRKARKSFQFSKR